MQKLTTVALCAFALADVWGLAQLRDSTRSGATQDAASGGRTHEVQQPSTARGDLLEFHELFAASLDLKPSAKTLALAGKSVRMVGFMAQMELAPRGGFYLTPRPVRCDEAGGGTADLPPESVFVIAPSAAGREVPFAEGALEVNGVLEVGNQADSEGRVSGFRLRLEQPTNVQLAANSARAKN